MDITKIPGIMRHHNWTNGARLMESWFSRPVAVKPGYGSPPEYVKMDWALGYPEGKKIYNEIINNKVWSNEAARREVRKMLEKQNLLKPGTCAAFGDLSKDAAELDEVAVNFRSTSGYYGGYYSGMYGYYDAYEDLTDLTAALGRFVMKVAIAGSVEAHESLPGKYKVTVGEIGVFIRDSYDFEGDQHLGYWDPDDNSVSVVNFLSGDKVTNESFRDWRASNGKGGDFLVFSDVKRTILPTPDVFNV
jgi:hypothetical protein